MFVPPTPADALTPTAIALGNFDGVHRGHRQVIAPIFGSATPSHAVVPTATGCPTVVTFDPHPRAFFSGDRRPLLTPLDEKAKALEDLGVEQLVSLPFDAKLAALGPEAFVEFLLAALDPRLIAIGRDFRFGCQRAGTAADLQRLATRSGVEVAIAELKRAGGDRISSSRIRQALAAGEVATATDLLGRPYSLCGTVVVGQRLGRTIGFPTANVRVPDEKFLPRFGVYCVRALVEQASLLGVMNLGMRPTVSGTLPTIEVHLLDWSGDLYGRAITIELIAYMRGEQKFPNLDALKAQIADDCDAARQFAARL